MILSHRRKLIENIGTPLPFLPYPSSHNIQLEVLEASVCALPSADEAMSLIGPAITE